MKTLNLIFAVLFAQITLTAQANLWLKRVDPVNEYFRIPILNLPSLNFSGVVENIGDSAATSITVTAYVYNSSSSLVHSDISGSLATLLPGDSMQFSMPAFALPAIEEEYIVKCIVTMSEIDPDTNDNILMLPDSIYVTDTIFARDNDEPYLPIGAGGNSGGFLGQQLVVNQPAVLTSISGYLTAVQPCDVAFVVFAFNGIPGWVPIATSDTVHLGAVPGWVTLPMKIPAYLAADTFVIAAQQFSSTIDLNICSRTPTFGTTWVRWQAIGGWHNIEYFGNEYALPFMLRANLNFSAGIEQSVTNSTLYLFPNPADRVITIIADQASSIEITNTLGQVVTSVQPVNARTVIDVSALPAGLYFVNVSDAEGIHSQRLVVE